MLPCFDNTASKVTCPAFRPVGCSAVSYIHLRHDPCRLANSRTAAQSHIQRIVRLGFSLFLCHVRAYALCGSMGQGSAHNVSITFA